MRYNVFYRHKESKAYAHHLLFMFCPFRVESDFKSGEPHLYFAKSNKASVIDKILTKL